MDPSDVRFWRKRGNGTDPALDSTEQGRISCSRKRDNAAEHDQSTTNVGDMGSGMSPHMSNSVAEVSKLSNDVARLTKENFFIAGLWYKEHSGKILEMQGLLDSQRTTINKQAQQYEELVERYKEETGKFAKLELSSRDQLLRIEEQQDAIRRSKTTIYAYEAEMKRLVEHQRSMEAQILAAQVAMSKKSIRPSVKLGEQGRTIEGHFLNIQNEIRAWAKKWTTEKIDMIDSVGVQDKNAILQELSQIVVLDKMGYPPRWNKMGEMASVLYVSAILGHSVYAEVLAMPFRPLRPLLPKFALRKARRGAQDEDQNVNSTQSALFGDMILQHIYNKLSSIDKARAQIWRRELTSIFDPGPDESQSEEESRLQSEAATRRAQIAASLASDFLNYRVLVHLSQVAPEDMAARHKQLRTIFQGALDISGRLWKQLPVIECMHLPQIHNQVFTHGSQLLAAHAFHKLGFDDRSENRLDNQPIRIVVFPAIIGFGSPEGEKYSEARIWGKGVVYLDEPQSD